MGALKESYDLLLFFLCQISRTPGREVERGVVKGASCEREERVYDKTQLIVISRKGKFNCCNGFVGSIS